jgi:hypothetical protein
MNKLHPFPITGLFPLMLLTLWKFDAPSRTWQNRENRRNRVITLKPIWDFWCVEVEEIKNGLE